MSLTCIEFLLIVFLKLHISVQAQNDVNDIDLKNRVLELSVSTPWDMIKRYNYPVENHNITTEDGYILSVQRIPGGKYGKKSKKPPVLFIPGLFVSSAAYLHEDEAIAYKLADLGYDVWLQNYRGITYSTNHKYYLPDSTEYWNFTFHEIGVHDVPNTIDYILERSKYKSLYLISHSQGGAIVSVTLSKLPEYNKKVRLAIHLGPAIYLNHVLRAIKMVAKSSLYNRVEEFIAKNGYFGILQNSGLLQALVVNEVCGRPSTSKICASVMMYLVGPNFDNVNLTYLPIFMSHYPNGASIKQIAHYAQIIRTGHFVEYTEYEKFLQPTYKPKFYNFSAISAPNAVIYSRNDWITTPSDVERFMNQLPNLVMQHIIKDKFFNHVDFLIGKNRFEMVDKHVIALMEKF